MINRALILMGYFVASLLAASSLSAASEPVRVVASLQPLYSILSALAQGANIEAQAIPATMPGLAQTPRALSRLGAAEAQGLARADAVITIASIWPEDPLFREARARNIRIVQIDAARSLGKGAASVMLTQRASSNAPWRVAAPDLRPSPYVWFSLPNAIRMAEIIAADLKRLAPADEARVDANLAAFSRRMQGLRAEFDAKFLQLEDPQVFSLTDRFVYLTNDLGLFVSGYFLEDDLRWSQDDLAAFSAFLSARGVRRVIHHWRPSDEIMAAIETAGAQLVILDDGEGSSREAPVEPDPNRYQSILRGNLDALHHALSTP